MGKSIVLGNELPNGVIASADRLVALLEEQEACIERIMAILDK